jgi:hypothetical protein
MTADATPNTKINIQPLFATPVAIATLPENQRISAARIGAETRRTIFYPSCATWPTR